MENNNSGRPVTGMFRDRESAERAYDGLEQRGYTQDEINVMMSDETRKRHFSDDDHESHLGNNAMEGVGKGASIGGAVGAVAGIIAAIGTTLVIPGLGLVIAGPIAAGLAGAGAGSITGGLIGALVGSGVPKEHAEEYEKGIKNGHIVMGVKPRTEEEREHISRHWEENNAEHIYR
ncbi:MAG: hypothetical protein JO301_14535 [Chitinophagaceae bacterium]|nr:hypothetical protein [Chitinophagaceae bacterium]